MILIERNVMRMSEIGCEPTPGFVGGTIRRVFPQLLSNVTVPVQPIQQPTGIAYALRYVYQNNNPIPKFSPWKMAVDYDIASMYPNVVDKSQFNVKLPPLKYKREFVWHRSRKKKM